MLDIVRIARWRFSRDAFAGYWGNNWRPNRKGWRQVLRNVKMLADKSGWTRDDFPQVFS